MKVFITGTFRSGTTLVAQILDQNTNMGVTYDSVHFMRFGYLKYGKNVLSLEAAKKLGESFNKRLETRFNRGFDLSEYNKKIESLGEVHYADLWDAMMQLYVNNSNWGEKTVLQWRNARDILEMFQDIVIIHCVRDPRDVLSSWKNETYAPGVDYLDAIGNCYDSMRFAQKNKQEFGDRYQILRFEDLLADPEKETKKLCQALNITFDKEMLSPTNYKNKVTQEKWQPNTAFSDEIKGISTKPLNRWRKHLPKEDLLLCELVTRDFMEEFGYALSGDLAKTNMKEIYSAISKLQQSPLALNGVLNILHTGQGVQRNPLDDTDPSTWETDVEKL